MKLLDFLGFVSFLIVTFVAVTFLPLKPQYWLYVSKIETLYKNVNGVEFAQKPSWLQQVLTELQRIFKNFNAL